MVDTCNVCGLTKDLCVCGTLRKTDDLNRIKVYLVKAKFKKFMTVVEGIEKKDLKDVFKLLKRKLACGGALKDNIISLQGDHKKKMLQILIGLGYKEENIEIN